MTEAPTAGLGGTVIAMRPCVSANWQQLRRQWEISHAIDAAVTFAGFCSLILSAPMTRR